MSVENAIDPEEAFIASLASCHMLWFLSIVAKRGFVVESYVDSANDAMNKNAEGNAARTALEVAGIEVFKVRDVVIQRLKQAVPGQLGQLTRHMADAGVNIEVLDSDHAHQLVLVVDNIDKARAVSAAWANET